MSLSCFTSHDCSRANEAHKDNTRVNGKTRCLPALDRKGIIIRACLDVFPLHPLNQDHSSEPLQNKNELVHCPEGYICR